MLILQISKFNKNGIFYFLNFNKFENNILEINLNNNKFYISIFNFYWFHLY